MNGTRALTETERETFLQDNHNGILAFTRGKPHSIPVHYYYIKRTVVFEMLRSGRIMDYIKKSCSVCFNVWQEGEQSTVPSLKKERNTSVILEGELEEVTKDKWSYYELHTAPEGIDMVGFILKVNTVGTICTSAGAPFG